MTHNANKYRLLFLLTGILFIRFFSGSLANAQSLGNGRDGSPDIAGIVNSYTFLINDALKCEDILYVDNAQSFKTGDLILIIQMQGASIIASNTASYGTIVDYANAGNYEYAFIKQIEGNAIYLEYALLRSYNSDAHVQVIRVPQYKKPFIKGTLSCLPWDGQTGGVLAIDVTDTLIFESNINVSGKGFRSGEHHTAPCIFTIRYDYVADSPDPRYYALKGEGIAGYGIGSMTSARGAPANAGGGGNIHTTGGGGGGNAGCGGDGGWGYPVDTSGGEKLVFGLGGHSLDYSVDNNKFFVGGGGGAGHEHYGNATSGANGGGLVIISANAIQGNGKAIFARGANSASGGAYGDGVGGAGAGGTVIISADTIINNLTADVSGGNGGSSIAIGFGPGGGGGGGLCWIKGSSVPANLNVLSAGGIGGMAGGSSYGAQTGCNGNTMTGLTLLQNTQYPSVHADFIMSPTSFTIGETEYSENTAIIFTNYSTGGNFSQWDFGDLETSTETNPIHKYEEAGDYTITLIEGNELCIDTAIKTVFSDFKIPNVFTPNADGINDFFPGLNLQKMVSFEVLNRWGETVFKMTESNHNWDGNINSKPATCGVYYFVLEYIDNEGTSITTKGTVTLLR